VLPGDKFVLGSAVGNISFQSSQILGFVAGAAVVAVVDPYRTLGLDTVSFGISALIVVAGVRPRPLPRHEAARPSLWAVSADGIRIVFGNRRLLTLVLLGWLAGFYIVPEGLAVPYAHSLRGSTVTVGLLMAAMPSGMVVAAFALSKMAAPSTRMRDDGVARHPVLRPADRKRGGPAAVVRPAAMGPGRRGRRVPARRCGLRAGPAPRDQGPGLRLAQSGLYAVQGLGILACGAVAQAIGAPLAVGLAGLTAATMLAVSWTQLHGHLPQAAQPGAAEY
jgi:hypothetical protein